MQSQRIGVAGLFLTIIIAASAPAQTQPLLSDLSATISAASTVAPGQIVPFQITVTNNGPSDADDVTVSLSPGRELSIISEAGQGWACDPAEGICHSGLLRSGSTSSIVGSWQTPNQLGSFDASVRAITKQTCNPRFDSCVTDPNPVNNGNSVHVTIADNGREAKLVFSFPSSTAGTDEYRPVFRESAVVTNSGPSSVDGVIVRISGSVQSASGSGWNCIPRPHFYQTLCVYDHVLLSGASSSALDVTLTTGTYEARPINAKTRQEAEIVTPNRPVLPALPVDTAADFVKILLPIAAHPIAGAFGSEFQTTVSIYNGAPHPLRGVGIVSPTDYSYAVGMKNCYPPQCPQPKTIESGSSGYIQANMEADQPGTMLTIRRSFAPKVELSIHVTDTSRSGFTAGSEIPVVPEDKFRRGMLSLIGLPGDRRYRTTLRIYGPDGEDNEPVVIRFYSGNGTAAIAEHTVTLKAADNRPFSASGFPSYAQVGSVAAEFPGVAGFDPVRIEVQPVSPTLRFWAFATVTNNETQQLTTFSPR